MNKRLIVRGVENFLKGLGLDLQDQHLVKTPERVAKTWIETFASGYNQDVSRILSVDFSEDCDEMIILKDIPFLSHCAHHLIPFCGYAKIGYVPKNGRIVGLSKLARCLDVFAHRLQVQERLTVQVAKAIRKYLKPQGVGVIIEAEHFCVARRGVQKPGSKMVTSCLLGKMRTDKAMRTEFLNF